MAVYTFEKMLEQEVTTQPAIKSNGAAAEAAVQKLKSDVRQVSFALSTCFVLSSPRFDY